jgi:organic radical activating enzyme
MIHDHLREYLRDNHEVELPADATMTEFVAAYQEAKGAETLLGYNHRMTFINFDLNSYCNLSCYGCNHFIDSAQTKESMSLEQVKEFVRESKELRWPWLELRLSGGEPTLHPQFLEICDEILKLKDYLPNIVLKTISNETGFKVQQILKKMPKDFLLSSSKPLKDTMRYEEIEENPKTEIIPTFGNCYQSPVDRLDEIRELYKGNNPDNRIEYTEGYIRPDTGVIRRAVKEGKIISCQVHATCGWEITPYGYTPCPCGGGRVIGDKSVFYGSLQQIIDEGNEGIAKRLRNMCSTCGRNLNYTIMNKTTTEKTDFFKLVLDEFGKNPPHKYLQSYPYNAAKQK